MSGFFLSAFSRKNLNILIVRWSVGQSVYSANIKSESQKFLKKILKNDS